MAEEKNIATGYIGNALRSSAADHTTTFADEVFDTERQKYQSEVNTDLEQAIADEVARAQEAELANTTAIVAEKNRAEAAEEAIIYDVSSHNDDAVFESLSALLGNSNLDTLIPVSFRHGGMTIRYVQSSDNKYVQYRLMKNQFSTVVADWQGVDDEPTAGSENLVKSKAIERISSKVLNYAYEEILNKNTALNKYYNTNWNTFFNDSEGRKASNPIYLKVGDRIKVYTAGMNAQVYGIVIWCPTDNIDTSVEQFVTKVAGIDVTGFQTYEYVVDKDGYYIICWHSVYTESYAKIYHKETNIITTHINISKTVPILPQRKKLPCISLEFDDCIEGDEDAYNICKGYGIRCSFSFIASQENIAEKRERYIRYQNDGFSILSHSIDDRVFNTTNYPTAADAFTALYMSRKRLEDAGFIINGFVAPNSTFVTDYLAEIEKVYNYAFTGLGDDSVNYKSRRCNLTRYSMQTMTLDDGTYNSLKGRIAIAKSFGYNMTFYAHMRNVADTGTGANEWSYEKLRAFIAFLVSERDAGNIFISNTDECMRNYFDSDRMLQDGWLGSKHLIFNDDNTISWE